MTTAPPTVSDAHRAVARDARRLLSEQATLAELAPSTGPLAGAAATPFGWGYVLGVVDALCGVHGAPFDATALGVWAAVLEEAAGRPAPDALDAALDALRGGADTGGAGREPYGFAAGREYGGNEALGWSQGACVPAALVHLSRVRS
ncbi:hypothetical protein [Rubrivirga litoralis]|uniref:Uncharacterized protein n=1 Tax=Rubrivirga litoralis TaxID=3075598 RepID=A0ABU3BSR6_9BACT|nr:hypothetical protein [Rubrivirga sp. F394]MDT0632329.1 hypothetical protein [Rubrivirga sp. F394]